MATYLHQVIAVERSAEADAKRALGEAARILAVGGDSDPLTGLSRTHRSLDPEQHPVLPPENRKVQAVTADLLASVQKAQARIFDVKLTRETGNAAARADVVVDGETILADVPPAYLLFLESRLAELIPGLIDKLPSLDPAEEWHDHTVDPVLRRGVWASAARETKSTTKLPQVQVLSPAQVIDGHAFEPKVQSYTTDQVTGYWTLVRYSGQLPAYVIQEIRERAVKLLEAVRVARERANTIEVENRKAGQVILGYVFGDAVPSA